MVRAQAATSDPNGRARHGQMIDELSQAAWPWLEYRLRAAGRDCPENGKPRARRGLCLAERVGFEPTVGSPYA